MIPANLHFDFDQEMDTVVGGGIAIIESALGPDLESRERDQV